MKDRFSKFKQYTKATSDSVLKGTKVLGKKGFKAIRNSSIAKATICAGAAGASIGAVIPFVAATTVAVPAALVVGAALVVKKTWNDQDKD